MLLYLEIIACVVVVVVVAAGGLVGAQAKQQRVQGKERDAGDALFGGFRDWAERLVCLPLSSRGYCCC